MDEHDIIEGLKPVCQCQGLAKKVFLKHIASGIRSIEALQRITGAGIGSCQGRRCTPRIEALLRSTADDTRHK